MEPIPFTVTTLHDFAERSVRIVQITPRVGPSQKLPSYRAGQFAVLQFGDLPAKPYSVARKLPDGHLEFHIRKSVTHPDGVSAYATSVLKTGDTVFLHNFDGSCVYDADCPRPVLLIAGGTGLAPLLAIAEASLNQRPERPVHLFHGGRHLADLYYGEELTTLMEQFPALTYTPVLSEDHHPAIQQGTVGEIALQTIPDLLDKRLYIAGPPAMMRQIVDGALNRGVKADFIHSDLALFQDKT